MNKKETTRRCISNLILVVILFFLPMVSSAQTPAVTATLSETIVQPNDTFTITLGIDTAVDAYYLGLEVGFDPQVFEFTGVAETGLMTGGISIADLISEGRIGASVTRTDQLATPGLGDMMVLTFRVLQTAEVGLSDFSFPISELYDSNGLLIDTSPPAVLSQEVIEGISNLRLDLPVINQIAEGEELTVNGSIYVNDISVDESLESVRVTVWVGLNASDTDPASWGESAWIPMEFNEQLDAYHWYQQQVGYLVEPGTYYIALRAQLDAQNYVYGGRSDSGGGLWDGSENNSAQLLITESPPFRYVLAGWNFDDESLAASSGVPANEEVPFQIVGASADGFTSGAEGQAADATDWQFTAGDEKYWLINITTVGFQNLTLSSKQSGTSSSPRDFQVEVSLDSLNWELVSEDTIRVSSSWSSGVIENLPLPPAYEDQPSVYIRWIRRGDIRVDDTEGITTGNNRIDDVFVRGENMNPVEVTVWPGDTNNNGLVDELDVLPLGQYWLSQGPPPVYSGIAWAARSVEAWIPEAATYADATGDGIVNYKDLLPVGLNFGETVSPGKIVAKASEPLAEILLQPLEAGESIHFGIETEEALKLTGVSYRFRIEGAAESSWSMIEHQAGPWAEQWADDDRLLSFSIKQKGSPTGSVSMVHKGRTNPKASNELAEFKIEATENWNGQARIVLERVVVATNREQQALETAELKVKSGNIDGPSGPDIPNELLLRQNYPNPFNPTTVISYSLPNDGPASMKVFDLLGREVTTLFNGPRKAGTYELRFDGSSLASGIYIYRLQAQGKVLTRMFTLIK